MRMATTKKQCRRAKKMMSSMRHFPSGNLELNEYRQGFKRFSCGRRGTRYSPVTKTFHIF